ncbi:type II secretion system GspH family protein [Patescibacteria group bacterium]|nr:type II secretion system GspH family protein [Patescibacteria group bacterium]
MKTNKIEAKGFTLLELLIVIAILAILSVTLVLVLNPAESLRKSRDTQRMSDLATLKTALGLYITTIGSPDLTTTAPDNNLCYLNGAGAKTVFYSKDGITDLAVALGVPFGSVVATTDGSGWLPVNLSAIVGGSPISNLPLDPSNTFANGGSTAALITNDALVYRYACNASNITFELNAKLESVAFTNDDDKAAKDGGDNSRLYEIGTAVNILPGTDDF